jgi:hypothetical protein
LLDHSGHFRRNGDDLFEVVQKEERIPLSDQRDDPLPECPPLGLLDVERFCESRKEACRVGHVSQRRE